MFSPVKFDFAKQNTLSFPSKTILKEMLETFRGVNVVRTLRKGLVAGGRTYGWARSTPPAKPGGRARSERPKGTRKRNRRQQLTAISPERSEGCPKTTAAKRQQSQRRPSERYERARGAEGQSGDPKGRREQRGDRFGLPVQRGDSFWLPSIR